jgi:hypothetical protein
MVTIFNDRKRFMLTGIKKMGILRLFIEKWFSESMSGRRASKRVLFLLFSCDLPAQSKRKIKGEPFFFVAQVRGSSCQRLKTHGMREAVNTIPIFRKSTGGRGAFVGGLKSMVACLS